MHLRMKLTDLYCEDPLEGPVEEETEELRAHLDSAGCKMPSQSYLWASPTSAIVSRHSEGILVQGVALTSMSSGATSFASRDGRRGSSKVSSNSDTSLAVPGETIRTRHAAPPLLMARVVTAVREATEYSRLPQCGGAVRPPESPSTRAGAGGSVPPCGASWRIVGRRKTFQRTRLGSICHLCGFRSTAVFS